MPAGVRSTHNSGHSDSDEATPQQPSDLAGARTDSYLTHDSSYADSDGTTATRMRRSTHQDAARLFAWQLARARRTGVLHVRGEPQQTANRRNGNPGRFLRTTTALAHSLITQFGFD